MIEYPIKTDAGGIWSQPATSDFTGTFWASFNLDVMDNEGAIRLGKRLILNTGTDDVATITGVPVNFIKCGTHVHAIAGASGTGFNFLNNGTLTGAFAKDVSSNAPTKIDSTISDSVIRSTSMYVIAVNPASSTLGYHKKTADGAWSQVDFSGALAVSAGAYPNMMTYYPQTGRVYFSYSQSSVGSIDTSDTVSQSGDYTLSLAPSGVLDNSNIITRFLPATDRIWILTVNSTGGKGYIYDWDGVSPNYNAAYRLDSSGALSGVVRDDVPYVMDTNGDFLYWNGGSFQKITGLNRRGDKPLWNPVSTVNDRFIHPNGMSLVNGRIQMLIDNRKYDDQSSIQEVVASGVYEYDERSKTLIHRSSPTLTKSDGTIVDYGANRINAAGAMKEMMMPSTASGNNGTVLYGFGYYSDATTPKYGIFYNDRNNTMQKAGYLVTPKIQAQGDKSSYALKNMWKHMDVVHRKLISSSDLVEIKFRTEESDPTEFTGTWTSTTTFTTSTDLSSYWNSSRYGGEIEVLNGVGAGRCSHVSVISGSGTFTVTVDQAHTGATGTFKGRAQNWKRVRQIDTQVDTTARASAGVQSTWIQFKIWMRFTGDDEIEKLTIVNENSVPAK